MRLGLVGLLCIPRITYTYRNLNNRAKVIELHGLFVRGVSGRDKRRDRYGLGGHFSQEGDIIL